MEDSANGKFARELKIGVLGAGPVAQCAHLDACRRARNADLYAICDADAGLLARIAEIHAPKVTYSQFDQMLADPAVDAVVIATADAFHIPLGKRAVLAGKHVFLEKPMGLDVAECEDLAAAAAQACVVLQIGFNRRFDPALAFARTFVREEIGRVEVLNAWYCDSVFRYTMTDNLHPILVRGENTLKPAEDPKMDKRRYFLLTHGSHLFDTAAFLGGPIAAVKARARESAGSYIWAVEVEFTAGCFGHLNLIVPARGDFEEGFQVFGSEGSIQGRLHLPWYRKAGSVECFSAKEQTYRKPLGADADTYKLQIEAFAAAILDGAPQHGATAAEGVANLRALVATVRSAECGRPVRLDEVCGTV